MLVEFIIGKYCCVVAISVKRHVDCCNDFSHATFLDCDFYDVYDEDENEDEDRGWDSAGSVVSCILCSSISLFDKLRDEVPHERGHFQRGAVETEFREFSEFQLDFV